MQELCRCFGAFSLLLVIRGLDQLGIEPVDLSQKLDHNQIDLEGSVVRARLSWSLVDGTLRLSIDGARPLRIVPLPVSLAMSGDRELSRLIDDADAAADPKEILLVLYPSPSSEGDLRRMAPSLAHRLNALSHEVAKKGQERAGFLPVSPWDLSSVERVARELRWVITAPRFLAYPPLIANPPIPNIADSVAWLEATVNGVAVTRAPEEQEDLQLPKRLADQKKRLQALDDEHKDVSQQLRKAVRDGTASGPLNDRKRALNAEITDFRLKIASVDEFSKALKAAIELVKSLLSCPTCGSIADPRRDFIGGNGHRFSCVCPGCSTKWGTEACPSCKAWIPTLMPAMTSWSVHEFAVGWLDRIFGADVLAVPVKEANDALVFVCPSCGHGARSDLPGA